MRSTHRAARAGMALAFLAAVALGCGPSKYKVVPVQGKVQFVSGTPLPAGTLLRFDPAEGGMQTATATVDSGGAFKLTHATGRSGAELGKYTVVLLPPKTNADEFYKVVPRPYYEGSGNLVAEVKEGMNPLELKVQGVRK